MTRRRGTVNIEDCLMCGRPLRDEDVPADGFRKLPTRPRSISVIERDNASYSATTVARLHAGCWDVLMPALPQVGRALARVQA